MNHTNTTLDNALLQGLIKETSWKTTENGAAALNTTYAPLLDLFGTIGALRTRSASDIIDLFMKAYTSNRLLAMKTLFYARDIRGGLGERQTFRTIAHHLALHHPEDILLNLALIPEYGRFDDLFIFFGTPLQEHALQYINRQFFEDAAILSAAKREGTLFSEVHISLLAKWLPSENASSHITKERAHLIRKALHLSSRQYRITLSLMRKCLGVVECKMSANAWPDIDYSAVPSVAALRYRAAFDSHDHERYHEFLDAVNTGTTKINASTLYPYDIVRDYINNPATSYHYDSVVIEEPISTLEAQWKALPDYINNSTENFLIMADVSGSMTCQNNTPYSTSIGLAIYFAERSHGAFKNYFMTFSEKPKLVRIDPSLTLAEKITAVSKEVGYNTNLEAAFELLLKTAYNNNVLPSEMPKAIIVISDMEIDSATHSRSESEALTFTEDMSRHFKEAGYTMPTLVYWNVCARQNTFHATMQDNIRFVSGQSPSVFKGLCENLGDTSIDLLLKTLNTPRYEAIHVATHTEGNTDDDGDGENHDKKTKKGINPSKENFYKQEELDLDRLLLDR